MLIDKLFLAPLKGVPSKISRTVFSHLINRAGVLDDR